MSRCTFSSGRDGQFQRFLCRCLFSFYLIFAYFNKMTNNVKGFVRFFTNFSARKASHEISGSVNLKLPGTE